MKKIFEFDCPQDDDDYKIFAQALEMYAVLDDLKNEMRQVVKYGKPSKHDKFWYERLIAICLERNVEI